MHLVKIWMKIQIPITDTKEKVCKYLHKTCLCAYITATIWIWLSTPLLQILSLFKNKTWNICMKQVKLWEPCSHIKTFNLCLLSFVYICHGRKIKPFNFSENQLSRFSKTKILSKDSRLTNTFIKYNHLI